MLGLNDIHFFAATFLISAPNVTPLMWSGSVRCWTGVALYPDGTPLTWSGSVRCWVGIALYPNVTLV